MKTIPLPTHKQVCARVHGKESEYVRRKKKSLGYEGGHSGGEEAQPPPSIHHIPPFNLNSADYVLLFCSS